MKADNIALPVPAKRSCKQNCVDYRLGFFEGFPELTREDRRMTVLSIDHHGARFFETGTAGDGHRQFRLAKSKKTPDGTN